MYEVQGSQVFTYMAGSRFGPFDLSGLLALIGGAKQGRALLQSGLSIESLDFDGRTLWVVLSTG